MSDNWKNEELLYKKKTASSLIPDVQSMYMKEYSLEHKELKEVLLFSVNCNTYKKSCFQFNFHPGWLSEFVTILNDWQPTDQEWIYQNTIVHVELRVHLVSLFL